MEHETITSTTSSENREKPNKISESIKDEPGEAKYDEYNINELKSHTNSLLKRQIKLSNLKYRSLIHIDEDNNGNVSVVRMFQWELQHLNDIEIQELISEFFRVAFSENDQGIYYFC